jgi:ABC-type transport system involved in cytochrome bd biosynthesis fused ATPase/permease subunit
MGAGERLAVIGPTGCGKTTLLLALLGYLPPSSGELLLGDHADGTAGLEAWRRRVSWLPQAPAIVTGSVLANVTLTAPEAGRREAAAALGRARADDLVASLGGIDTVLDEGGRRLSSGERQRIALARALCRRAELYLLDEPTAHLDAAIEQEVVAGILEGAGAAALVIVTHSPSVAAACDRVLDLDMLTGLVQGAGEVFRPLAGAIGRA